MSRTTHLPCLRLIILSGLLATSAAPAADQVLDPSTAKPDEKSDILWYDVKNLDVEGKGWTGTKGFYDRFPAQAEGKVRPEVWGLSRNSAGMAARFVTDAQTIHARWTLTSKRLEMPHMPSTGVSGLDLYVKGENGKFRWLANKSPSGETTSLVLATAMPKGKHEFLLYLPLYNGVSSVEIGIPKANSLAKGPAYDEAHAKPVVFYGTSICQGGCASRPGMVHTAILGRWLQRPVINLGFSGNGRMEKEVAELMAELDPACYVIDCLPNIGAKEVEERTGTLVKILRDAHHKTPILLVEDRNYTDSFFNAGKRERNDTNQAALKKEFEKLKAAGVEGLYYLEGKDLLGDDGEGTVDSSHPTDLGFMRQAEAFHKVLTSILK
ncbi:MAG: SGNH/GDSL hydrolase family protein [Planctomycetales bacterium]|nr:SGNH/GDSL hydrolase family protein [Planctomycetales bacterium]